MKLKLLISCFIVLTSCAQENVKNVSDLRTVTPVEPSIVKHEPYAIANEVLSPDIKMLAFLTYHFERIQDSTLLTKPPWMTGTNDSDTICGYILSFNEGHSFKHEKECVEWGEIVTVNFKGYTLHEVRKIVDLLFKTEGYTWHTNNTEYRPTEYYERRWTYKLKETQDAIELEFSYSWI